MNNSFKILANKIFCEQDIIDNAWIEVKEGIITAIDSQEPSSDIPIIDLRQKTILPGLIDLHIHGCNGYDVMDNNPNAINEISTQLATRGITSFLATTVTASEEYTLAALERLGKAVHDKQPGAQVLGIYSEGIFFSEHHKGAHDASLFAPPSQKMLKKMITASNNTITIVAMAAEFPEIESVIPWLCKKNIRVAIGHSNANYEQTKQAITLGATLGVHIFNGMKGLHHREPGCVGALLASPHVAAEIIADGVHVHPAVMKIITAIKKTEKTLLISDCNRAGMMPDGQYTLGSLPINVIDSIARISTGALAGSTLSLDTAIYNMIHSVGIDPMDAVHMASLSPAKYLGLDNKIGSIAVGKQADLIAVDKNYSVVRTWINGTTIYKNKAT